MFLKAGAFFFFAIDMFFLRIFCCQVK